VLAAQLFKDRFAERRQVIEAFAQRRNLDRQHIEAVIQVGAKLAALDRRFQIGGRRGDHPHIALDHVVGAHRFEFLFLQHPQQFALQRQGHVADLVEKQRAALGDLQLAGAALAVGAGKRAGRGAEELGFQQRSGIAALLMLTNALCARGEALWIAWASSSLPVPVSPSSNTGDSALALRRRGV
jgi:hypothetical protein